MKHAPSMTVAFLALALCAPSLRAQQPAPESRAGISAPAPLLFDASSLQDTAHRPPAWRPLRIAKWTILTASAGAGIYGFVQNGRADDRFRALESLCQAEQNRCSQRAPDGAYRDAEFEGIFDEVRALDGRSHNALLLSQVGVATGVILFLLDLGNAESPLDIPYVPGTMEFGPEPGGRVSLGLRIRR